jgi:hypothetical protein
MVTSKFHSGATYPSLASKLIYIIRSKSQEQLPKTLPYHIIKLKNLPNLFLLKGRTGTAWEPSKREEEVHFAYPL